MILFSSRSADATCTFARKIHFGHTQFIFQKSGILQTPNTTLNYSKPVIGMAAQERGSAVPMCHGVFLLSVGKMLFSGQVVRMVRNTELRYRRIVIVEVAVVLPENRISRSLCNVLPSPCFRAEDLPPAKRPVEEDEEEETQAGESSSWACSRPGNPSSRTLNCCFCPAMCT